MTFYNKTNTCDRCRSELGRYPRREYNKKGDWSGNWLCNICYQNYERYGTTDTDLISKIKKEYRVKRYKNEMPEACEECKIEKIEPKKAYREYDKEGNWTGRWLCKNCQYHNDYKFRPGCNTNIKKYLGDRRTGNLDLNSPSAKGDNFEELTCEWRSTISIIPVKNLNVENNNYTFPIDHSIDSILGSIDTTGKFYDDINDSWFIKWDRKIKYNDTNLDNIIVYCTDKYGKYIERIYIFPKIEILKRTGVNIIKTGHHWYEQYKIKDEKILENVNKIWQEIIK